MPCNARTGYLSMRKPSTGCGGFILFVLYFCGTFVNVTCKSPYAPLQSLPCVKGGGPRLTGEGLSPIKWDLSHPPPPQAYVIAGADAHVSPILYLHIKQCDGYEDCRHCAPLALCESFLEHQYAGQRNEDDAAHTTHWVYDNGRHCCQRLEHKS